MYDDNYYNRAAVDPFVNSMTGKVELHAGKNLTWFNSAMSRDDNRSRFMVLTSGNCGAIWFASALNLNEEIFAGCGIDHPIESCFLYNLQKNGDHLVAASTPDNYRFGVQRMNFALHTDTIMKEIFARHQLDYPILPRDISNLAWYVFDEIESMPFAQSRKALGSVHAFSADEFGNIFRNYPDILNNRRVVVANMIRHPLTRIESCIKAFEYYCLKPFGKQLDIFIDTNIDYIRLIEKNFGVSFESPRARAVLGVYRLGTNAVRYVAEELRRFHYMKAFKMESLQNDPDYFANAINILTSGRIVADNNYLDSVFKPENLGVGRRCDKPEGARPPGPRDQWELWSDWERFEFFASCKECDAYQVYSEYDYDFSFMSI